MAEQKKAKGGKKNRKHGRNALACKRYASSHNRERNKLRRLAAHLARFPSDRVATAAVDRAKAIIRGY